MFEDIPVAEDVLEMNFDSYTTIIARHENISAEIKQLQKEQDVIQTALMEKIANHEKAVCGSYQLDWGYCVLELQTNAREGCSCKGSQKR